MKFRSFDGLIFAPNIFVRKGRFIYKKYKFKNISIKNIGINNKYKHKKYKYKQWQNKNFACIKTSV